jgi:hypothetical protein
MGGRTAITSVVITALLLYLVFVADDEAMPAPIGGTRSVRRRPAGALQAKGQALGGQ